MVTCLISLFLEKLLQKLTEMLLKQMKFCYYFWVVTIPTVSQYYLRASVLGHN